MSRPRGRPPGKEPPKTGAERQRAWRERKRKEGAKARVLTPEELEILDQLRQARDG